LKNTNATLIDLITSATLIDLFPQKTWQQKWSILCLKTWYRKEMQNYS